MRNLYFSRKAAIISTVVFLAPFGASAQNFNNIDNAIRSIGAWIGKIIPFLITLAVVYFFWNAAQFVLHASDEGEREKGKQGMVWGVIAIFCMVSFWGLVGFLVRTSGLGQVGGGVPGVMNLPP